MKAVIQRVSSSRVCGGGKELGVIKKGFVVLLGIAKDDIESDLQWLLEKVLTLRVFSDEAGKMNLSILDAHGEILVISQFTLLAETQKGRRPSFINAADPEKGKAYYEKFIQLAKERGVFVANGEFGADMKVELVNDGPVTIVLDSANP